MSLRSNTTGTARHHAEWLSLVETSGPFLSMPVLLRVFPQGLDAHDPELSKRLRSAFGEWEATIEGGAFDPAYHHAWIQLVLSEVLELPDEVLAAGQTLPPGLEARFAEHGETLRPDWAVVDPDTRQPRLLLQVLPPSQHPERALAGSRWKASPATRMMELLHATDVKLGLVTNGAQWLLVHAPRGETTGFASWYAHLWLEEPLTLRAFRSLLGAQRFFGVADADTPSTLLAESSQDQQEVTDQLGYQVRQAVEVLVQAIDRVDQDRGRALLAGFDEQQLYQAALTIMMRLVFLFSAEERGLLLLGEPLYDQHYAVSTLLAQLSSTADQLGEEILERRHDAWARLLATFRAVHGGVEHDRMRLPAYGGTLFDPDRFPFLEGRPAGSAWRDTPALPLPIHNRTVLHLLKALQMLEVKIPGGGAPAARRISFRALDIEQIGHVYEGLLDHGAVRTAEPVLGLAGAKDREPEIPLRELEARAVGDPEQLVSWLAKETGRSANAVRKALADEADDGGRLVQACLNDPDLVRRVRPFAGLVRRDTEGLPVVISAGGVYVTQTGDRRSTGTHYTPRSLTEPIVRHALDPLVYHGPAEGLEPEAWTLHSAAEILALNVCDFAMGSGAFLVQACRYLSERLVEAWEQAEAAHPGQVVITPEGRLSEGETAERLLPAEPEERLAIARRAVTDACLYGVDKNPMAVEMAKLSLWLITLQKDRPFTFLDHALKCGDSLVGLTDADQLATWSLDRSGSRQLSLFMAEPLKQAREKRRQLRELPERDVRDVQRKEALHREAERLTTRLKLAADLIVAPEFGIEQAGERANEAKRLQGEFVSFQREDDYLPNLRARADKLLGDVTPFHWCLEFPEVFEGERPGFDAIIGNPPFVRGTKISTFLTEPYLRGILSLQIGLNGNADLCAHFLRRGAALIGPGGTTGLLATNTISQGDTREGGLEWLIRNGATVYRATAALKWPGVAAVVVSVVHVTHRSWHGSSKLDGRACSSIDAHLSSAGHNALPPKSLRTHSCSYHNGSFLNGMGFVLDGRVAAQLLSCTGYDAVVKSYIGGREAYTLPDLSQTLRYVIYFGQMSEEEARRWPLAWDILKETVYPERRTHKTKQLRERWWQFKRPTPSLYAECAELSRVVVKTQVSRTYAFAFMPADLIFDQRLIVFPDARAAVLTLLQSGLHEVWADRYAATLKDDMSYTPKDCFETFPFPRVLTSLESIGETYHEHRRRVMLTRWEGLTKTYNRFHDLSERSEDIAELRRLHVAMDQAVAAAYGWTDLDLGHGFHTTKQGERYTVSDPARRELLDRLLALNHERYAEEVRQGLHEKGRGKGKTGGRKRKAEEDGGQGRLFEE